MKRLTCNITVALALTLLTACNTKEIRDRQEPKVFVFDALKDSVPRKYIEIIVKSPEFRSWGYRPGGNAGRSFFETRKLMINDKIFYHIELFRLETVSISSSDMPLRDIACYFRVDPADDKIKILKVETDEFIDIATEHGRQHFQRCLK